MYYIVFKYNVGDICWTYCVVFEQAPEYRIPAVGLLTVEWFQGSPFQL